MNSVFIFVNGICDMPSRIEWTDKASAWINRNTIDAADKYEYFASPFFRSLTQDEHAEWLAKLILLYGDKPSIVLVAHSNGADIVLRAMEKTDREIETLHLFSAACEPDFGKNNLNHWLRSRRLTRVRVWTAGQDKVLVAASWSRYLLGWAGLGFGDLGRTGPVNVAEGIAHQVRVIHEPEYGHSSWFADENFDGTMRALHGSS